MTTSDTFAGIALLVSLASLYFQFLHRRDAVVCNLIGYAISDTNLIIKLAISNTGTRPILLSRYWISLEFKTANGGGVGFALSPSNNSPTPTLIPRDEIRVVETAMPMTQSQVAEIIAYEKQYEPLSKEEGWPIWTHINFITAAGRTLGIEKLAIRAKWYTTGGFVVYPPKVFRWRSGEWPIDEYLVI